MYESFLKILLIRFRRSVPIRIDIKFKTTMMIIIMQCQQQQRRRRLNREVARLRSDYITFFFTKTERTS